MTLNQNEYHLPVGHVLKKVRKGLGLTQKQMAAGIISTSYYSKVENEQHEIDAESLFKILHAHNYTIRRFEFLLFQASKPEDNDTQSFRDKLKAAQNAGSKEALNELFEDLKAKKYSDSDEITVYDIAVAAAYAWMKESNKDIPDAIKKAAKSRILKENWTVDSIASLSSWMMLLDIDECYILVNSIIDSYDNGNLDINTVYDEVAVNIVVVNYCDYCQIKNVDKKYVEKAIKFFKTSRKTPDPGLIGYSILGTYYEALFNHDMKKARIIRDILVESRADWSIRRSIKKLEE